ncbi:hypothetical protein RQP46_000826 [Phenoliferia psychrophenolica]
MCDSKSNLLTPALLSPLPHTASPDSTVELFAVTLWEAKIAYANVLANLEQAELCDPGFTSRVLAREAALSSSGDSELWRLEPGAGGSDDAFLDTGPGGFELGAPAPLQFNDHIYFSDTTTAFTPQSGDPAAYARTASSSASSSSPRSLFLSSLDSESDGDTGIYSHFEPSESWPAQPPMHSNISHALATPDWSDVAGRKEDDTAPSDFIATTSLFYPLAAQVSTSLPSSFGRDRTHSRNGHPHSFSPMTRHPLSPTIKPLESPSLISLEDMSLGSPPGGAPLSRSGSSSKSSSSGLPRKASTKRGSRKFDFDPSTDYNYPTNTEHLFYVFVQTRSKPTLDASGDNVKQLYLLSPPADSKLARTVRVDAPESYSLQDCQRDSSSYVFSEQDGTEWNVQYGLGVTTTGSRTSDGQRGVFLHFPPGSCVESNEFRLGSAPWWRLQCCEGPHEHLPVGMPGWTARHDAASDEARRPIRILDHFAKCKRTEVVGDFSPLRKLAGALMSR